MKRMILASCLVLASTGTAFASSSGIIPRDVSAPIYHSNATPMQKSAMIGSKAPDPSGRPSAILSPSVCRAVWKEALSNIKGDALTRAEAKPYVDNFSQVDTNNSNTISKAEFKRGCENGWIQSSVHKTVPVNPNNES